MPFKAALSFAMPEAASLGNYLLDSPTVFCYILIRGERYEPRTKEPSGSNRVLLESGQLHRLPCDPPLAERGYLSGLQLRKSQRISSSAPHLEVLQASSEA